VREDDVTGLGNMVVELQSDPGVAQQRPNLQVESIEEHAARRWRSRSKLGMASPSHATASPSIRNERTCRAPSASAISEKRGLQSWPFLVNKARQRNRAEQSSKCRRV
jgi:hypothetical protein